ncbi:MAG TPA: hypothetical protein VNZ86_03790 [Bacteroidia bacterium]|jgi:hypothetical protein|nr:hypothetical protein [Bacteroidia bacterium]
MKKGFDNLYLGLALGILVPVLTYFLYYLYAFRFMPIKDFIGHQSYNGILLDNFKRCLIGNLVPFFACIYTERMQSARGILFSMFIYGGLIAYFVFIA